MGKNVHVVRLDDEAREAVEGYADKKGISLSEATTAMVKVARGRLAALGKDYEKRKAAKAAAKDGEPVEQAS